VCISNVVGGKVLHVLIYLIKQNTKNKKIDFILLGAAVFLVGAGNRPEVLINIKLVMLI
jgi:hypothetical protein